MNARYQSPQHRWFPFADQFHQLSPGILLTRPTASASLPAGKSCEIKVKFKPTVVGRAPAS